MEIKKKLKVGVLGGTGMVGQRFISLLDEHPWFVAVQYHPEFKSKPTQPHPLFKAFIAAAVRKRRGANDEGEK